MDYTTYEPSSGLKPFINCYWTLEGDSDNHSEKQKIIPDGCIEMIFHYGDLYKQYLPSGQAITQPRCFVIGQLSRPLEIQPTGKTGIFSIRFNPDGFAPLSPVSISDLEDKAVSLSDLFGAEGAALSQQVIDSRKINERINFVEDFLIGRFQDVPSASKLIKSTIDMIMESRGKISVLNLSENQKVSRRSIERKMAISTGLSPKRLAKVTRLQTVLKQLIKGEHGNLTTLAYDGAYYDQSHFIKDFKDITGMTPKEFYGENLKMSAIFYGSK